MGSIYITSKTRSKVDGGYEYVLVLVVVVGGGGNGGRRHLPGLLCLSDASPIPSLFVLDRLCQQAQALFIYFLTERRDP